MSVRLELCLKTGMLCCILFNTLPQDTEEYLPNIVVVIWDCSHREFVLLQNIHLVKKWLPALEKKMERYSQGSHSDYRMFLSAEPAATPAAHIIPQVFSLSVIGRIV
jgi:hypothetical protein